MTVEGEISRSRKGREMSETDLMEVVDAYLVRTGRAIDERNRLNAIYTNPRWQKLYPAWKEKQKQLKQQETRPRQVTSAQSQAIVNEWLDFEKQTETRSQREFEDRCRTSASGNWIFEWTNFLRQCAARGHALVRFSKSGTPRQCRGNDQSLFGFQRGREHESERDLASAVSIHGRWSAVSRSVGLSSR